MKRRVPAGSAKRASAPTRKSAAGPKTSASPRAASPGGEIKVTRNSARPQIKASRGPGGPVKRRKVANPQARRTLTAEEKRVAETRRQSLSTMGSGRGAARASGRTAAPRKRPGAGQAPRSGAARGGSVRGGSGEGGSSISVRAVAITSGGGAAAARVVQEVARPVGAATAPVLRVVTGGLDALPKAAGRTTPITRTSWLVVFAALLAAGLIYINVGELKAGDGYAAYSARSLELQRENMSLRTRIANLGAAERIKAYAERQGLVMPAPEQFSYLDARRGDAERAAGTYQAPSSSARPLDPGATAPVGASAATGAVPAPQSPSPATTPTTGAGL